VPVTVWHTCALVSKYSPQGICKVRRWDDSVLCDEKRPNVIHGDVSRPSVVWKCKKDLYLHSCSDSWVKRDQLHVTCFIISLFNAQHVSDVNTSILRSLRLICWVISWVVLLWFDVYLCYVVVWLWLCGIRMQASACIRIPHLHSQTTK